MNRLFEQIKIKAVLHRIKKYDRIYPPCPDNRIWFFRQGFYNDETLTDEQKAEITERLGFFAEIEEREPRNSLQELVYTSPRVVVLNKNDIGNLEGLEERLFPVLNIKGIPFLIFDAPEGNLRAVERKYLSLFSSQEWKKLEECFLQIMLSGKNLAQLLKKHPEDPRTERVFFAEYLHNNLVSVFGKAGSAMADSVEAYNRTLSEILLSGARLPVPRYPITHVAAIEGYEAEEPTMVLYKDLRDITPGQFTSLAIPSYIFEQSTGNFELLPTGAPPSFQQAEKGYVRCSLCSSAVKASEENSEPFPTGAKFSQGFSTPIAHIAYLSPVCSSEKCKEIYRGMVIHEEKKDRDLKIEQLAMGASIYQQMTGRQVTLGQVPSLEDEIMKGLAERSMRQRQED